MHIVKQHALLPLIGRACSTSAQSTAPAVLLGFFSCWKHPYATSYSTSAQSATSSGDGHPNGHLDRDSSSTGTDGSVNSSSQDEQVYEQQQHASRRDNAYRRGFGAKVALPASDVLQEVLVGHPATFKLRAYHIGKRIHIGQVLQWATSLGCRTNSGKDYCIIWLNPATLEPSSSSTKSRVTVPSQQHELWAASKLRTISAATLTARMQQIQQYIQQQQPKPAASAKLQQQQQRRDTAASPPTWDNVARSALQDNDDVRGRSPFAGVPPMLVVYRYGSVVFAGTPVTQEPEMIDKYVPAYVRYKAGGDGNTWTMRDPMMESHLPQEEQTVVIKPDATEPAVKGVDKVELRVLDVGSVRVLTSVLGQSVALKFYETSVGDALDKLSQWRARTRRAAGYQRTTGLGILAGSQEQTTLFKVIAASALIITEARELLEMAEPAWQYSTYHSIWSLAADDFELEKRFRALETKLHLHEQQAKHDVKQREGRKYHKLEQSVILLLVVSCMLAILDKSRKVLSSSSSSSSSEGSALDAAAAGLSVEEGSLIDAAVDAVQQLQLQTEEAATTDGAEFPAAYEEAGASDNTATNGEEWDGSSSSAEQSMVDESTQTSNSNSSGGGSGVVSRLRRALWPLGRGGSM